MLHMYLVIPLVFMLNYTPKVTGHLVNLGMNLLVWILDILLWHLVLVCGLSFVFFDVLVCMRTLHVNFQVVLGCVTIALVLDTLSLERIHV